MKVVYWAGLALLLDLCLGDPRWLPHPVRGLGVLIAFSERGLRAVFPKHEKLAGILLAGAIGLGTYGFCSGLVIFSQKLAPFWRESVQVILIYFSLAPRDLGAHGLRVFRHLKEKKLEMAKSKVSMMVGRDVAPLDEKGVIRAAVESIAENTVDGVVAPLFFALLGGGPAAMAYRAVNTLDSMVGYREPPYTRLGWASARLDDLLNFLPARLTAGVMPLAGVLFGGSVLRGYRVLLRDGRKHESPNAGLPEAAMAGLLGVQLRGPHYYSGICDHAPFIGFAERGIKNQDILKAIGVMAVSTLFIFLLLASFRWLAFN
ncbi:MAG: cobalamin biosynthesis protein CobD [Nitrospirae bacterium]|nr:cobalamin biosynthesis protein CobD [Nitrospirota bacterium]MBI3352748.1 cobalamin biosynthesis protein CobD [Nitrospirota bacterium]